LFSILGQASTTAPAREMQRPPMVIVKLPKS
jgi:hypothetical protein